EVDLPVLVERGRDCGEDGPQHSCDCSGVRFVLVHGAWRTATGRRPSGPSSASARDVAIDAASVAGLPLGVVALAAGHFPMLSHPRELADALEELALVRPAGEADERPRGDP